MTDVTDLGEIRVVGQRRRSDGTFPSRGSGAGGGGNNDTGAPEQEEVDPGDFTPDDGQDPCSDPATALEWNADAAAAEGLQRMKDDAGDPLLDNRERSFVIARDPTTGRISLGGMLVGDPNAGTVGFDMTGIDPANIIGLMHSHPGSGPYPSGPDRQSLFPYWRDRIAEAGGNPNQLRLYMVGTHNDQTGARLQIQVYNHTNMSPEPGPDNPGPEVNPNAQPCS